MTTPEELDARHAADAIAAMNSARDFPTHTCPASRHAAMIAEGLAGEGYAMLSEEPQHCATTIAAVVESLWKARARVAELEALLADAYGAELNWKEILQDAALWQAQDDIGKSRVAEMTATARATAAEAELARRGQGVRFYIDCEFDGHTGPLLSIAVVREDGYSIHVSTGLTATDPWVISNVLPILDSHQADEDWTVGLNEVGIVLRRFIGDCPRPVIIADSPVDIARFCQAISTGEDGGWASTDYPGVTFIVENVDCYPTSLAGAIRHNAWWDAMALRAALVSPGDAATPASEGADHG